MSGDKDTLVSQCPHCFGRLEFEVAPKYRLEEKRGVDLSIAVVTTAQPRALAFLQHMRDLATDLGAEFVVGYDVRYGHANMMEAHKYGDITALVKSKGYIESVLQDVIDSCNGTWILRLDDDEMVSPAMWKWLKEKKYLDGRNQIWQFPEATLFPTTMSFISSHPFWTDAHPRLTTWKYAKFSRTPHGGCLYGPGMMAPVCITHHKLLIKPIDERRKLWEVRDKGKSDNDQLHAQMTVPEEYFDELILHPLGDGYFDDPQAIRGVGEVIKLTKPENVDKLEE